MAVKSPTVPLGCLRCSGCSPKPENVLTAAVRRLSCNPKGFWKAWQEDVLQLQRDWRISTKEMVLSAAMKTSSQTSDVSVLVDTGAKIPLAFRKGLLAEKSPRQAAFPVHFSLADGQAMDGGKRGTFLELRIPVWSQGQLITAKTTPLFAYEVNLHGVDIIMGYPFLRAFYLNVDTEHDRLCHGP